MKHPRVHKRIGTLVFVLIVFQGVFLMPSPLEEAVLLASGPIDPKTLAQPGGEKVLAQGIPSDRIPEYSIDQFEFVASKGNEKQWKLFADKAYFYSSLKIVHGRSVKALLYDHEGKITAVTARESKYFTGRRDIEMFGDVEAVMPDGFTIKTPYLRYRPQQKKMEIPETFAVQGFGAEGKEHQDQRLSFESFGMDYDMQTGRVFLPRQARVVVDRGQAARVTRIESDTCELFRKKQLALFRMNVTRPLASRFVQITQPTLFVRGRLADLLYGDFSSILQTMTVRDDVFIRELDDPNAPKTEAKSLRYGTAGQADFDSKSDVIVLSEFPQVYQDGDTVTGEVIRLHRDTDVVEVEQSNAFSEGRKP